MRRGRRVHLSVPYFSLEGRRRREMQGRDGGGGAKCPPVILHAHSASLAHFHAATELSVPAYREPTTGIQTNHLQDQRITWNLTNWIFFFNPSKPDIYLFFKSLDFLFFLWTPPVISLKGFNIECAAVNSALTLPGRRSFARRCYQRHRLRMRAMQLVIAAS